MVGRLKIDISTKNPYDAVADWIIFHSNPHTAYAVKIRTTTLGESIELLYDDGPDWTIPVWTWENDWYEGGEVELLGWIPIDDIVGDTEHTANWVNADA